MAQVVLEHVEKRHGHQLTVSDLNLTVGDGELLALVGPSGCGKSTTLRMVAGLETISGGELRIGAKRMNEVEPKDRGVAMVFQSYALYPHKTVFQNMAFGLKMRKAPENEIRARVEEAAKMLDLSSLLNRYPSQLSGGQRQRVAMGRAIVRRPDVFLFDEPLSNLDAKLRSQVRWEIAKLHRSLRTTTLYVTHDQVEAMTLANRIAVMNHGVLEQVGPPMELYERPATRFVAGFIGAPAMNFFVLERGEGLLRGAGVELLSQHAPKGAGEKVVLGVRPEHLRRDRSGDEFRLRLQIDLVERLGAEAYVTGSIGETTAMARLEPDERVAEGELVTLSAPRSKLHFFEPTTQGRALLG